MRWSILNSSEYKYVISYSQIILNCDKITGDGTSISRTVYLVVIIISLLDVDKNPSSPYRYHTITLLNTTEDYDNLYEALANIADEMKHLHSINVEGRVQF